jgi:hypothetical protein
MKKLVILVITIVILCSLFTGCATVTYPAGVMNLDNPIGSKEGRASGKLWFDSFGNVDISVQTAARKAGITRISSVQIMEKAGFLWLWREYTVIVSGE